MELDRWVKVFDRLLPRSRAWNLVFNRVLRKFFHGISILPQLIHNHLGSILLEAFPQTTTHLHDWSWQLGSPLDFDADDLEDEYQDEGGQSPGYLQDLLHRYGFTDLYVHEWWVPGTDPLEFRDFHQFVDTDRVLVNDLAQAQKNYLFQFGAQDGESDFVSDGDVYFGAYDGWFLESKRYPCPDIEQETVFYYYVCGETWPDRVTIYESQLRTLIRLIYKQKPCYLRCILRLNVIPDPGDGIDGDWQDVIADPDDIQDAIAAADDNQDAA